MFRITIVVWICTLVTHRKKHVKKRKKNTNQNRQFCILIIFVKKHYLPRINKKIISQEKKIKKIDEDLLIGKKYINDLYDIISKEMRLLISIIVAKHDKDNGLLF